MRAQVWILGGSFIIFALIAWALLRQFSVAYVALLGFGIMCLIIGALSPK